MLRDYLDKKSTHKTKQEVAELFKDKAILEAWIVQQVTNFEMEHSVIIDRVNFSRQITRTPDTIYTDLSLLME